MASQSLSPGLETVHFCSSTIEETGSHHLQKRRTETGNESRNHHGTLQFHYGCTYKLSNNAVEKPEKPPHDLLFPM
jgi:hypothetical protein